MESKGFRFFLTVAHFWLTQVGSNTTSDSFKAGVFFSWEKISSKAFATNVSEMRQMGCLKYLSTHRKFNSSPLKMDGWKTTHLLGG